MSQVIWGGGGTMVLEVEFLVTDKRIEKDLGFLIMFSRAIFNLSLLLSQEP
jgi:hypothetical protein